MLTTAHARAVADAFALGRPGLLEGPVARGVQGQVWRLRSGGRTWAVKEWFDGFAPEPDELEAGSRLQAAAVAAGLPAPTPRRTPSGAVVAMVDGVEVRVESWLELGGPTRDADPALVGRLLAGLHLLGDLEAGSASVDPWYVDAVGASEWRRLTGAAHDMRAPFADGLSALAPELLSLESCFEAPRSLLVCHRDLWPDNVLPSRSTGLAIIDWENAGPADPAHELAMVVFGFAGQAPGRAGALIAAYREAGGPARLEGRGAFTMAGACVGHILRMHVDDWLAAAGQPGRSEPTRQALARAADGVREALDAPLTVNLVDELLERAG